jgi:hypothetical protein
VFLNIHGIRATLVLGLGRGFGLRGRRMLNRLRLGWGLRLRERSRRRCVLLDMLLSMLLGGVLLDMLLGLLLSMLLCVLLGVLLGVLLSLFLSVLLGVLLGGMLLGMLLMRDDGVVRDRLLAQARLEEYRRRVRLRWHLLSGWRSPALLGESGGDVGLDA